MRHPIALRIVAHKPLGVKDISWHSSVLSKRINGPSKMEYSGRGLVAKRISLFQGMDSHGSDTLHVDALVTFELK